MKKIIAFLKSWYHGETIIIEPEQRDKNDIVGVMPKSFTRTHWTATLFRYIVTFYFRNWQWLWKTFIGILAALGIFKAFSDH